MKKLFLSILFFFILTSPLYALWKFNPYTHALDYYETGTISIYTVATLPGSPVDGEMATVTDGADAGDCTVGGGTVLNACMWDDGGSAWVIVGDGAGTGNSFSTMNAPAGTDPVATGDDTLNWAVTGPITITGDSATDTMTVAVTEITHELGGLEADVSAYSGLLGITGGATTEVNTAAELETFAGLGAIANEILDDANAAAVLVTLGVNATALEINTPLDGASVTLTEFQELETIGATTISANQWAALGGIAETLTFGELDILDGVTTTATQLNYLNGATGTTGTTTTNVVYSTSPTITTATLSTATLTGPLNVGAQEIRSTGSVVVQLGDAVGSDEFEIEDSDSATQFTVDSDGNMVVAGTINPSDAPAVTGHHNASDEDVFALSMSGKNAADATTLVRGFSNNGLKTFITHVGSSDGATDAITIADPVTAPAVDNGTMFYADTNVTIDLATSYSTVCEYVFINGDSLGNSTWTLPISPLCNDDALYMKKFTVINNDDTHLLLVKPGTGDTIKVKGSQVEACDADEALYVEVDGVVLLYGRTASTWLAIPLGGTNVLCGGDPSP